MEEETDYKRNEHRNLGHNMTNFIKINRAKQDSFDLDEIDDEWDETERMLLARDREKQSHADIFTP